MPSPATSANKLSLLRRMYGNSYNDHMWKKDPYFSDIKKTTSGFGEGVYRVVRITQNAGTSPSFDVAVANQSPSAERRFFVTERSMFHIFSLAGSWIRKARGKPNSLLKAYESEAKSAMNALDILTTKAAHGDVGGTIGQISLSANIASTTILMRRSAALYGLNPENMYIQASTDTGAGTSPAGLLDSGARVKVTGVSWPDNTLTVETALSTAIPSVSANSYLFLEGFYAASPTGKAGWLPITQPVSGGGDSFFGVDRGESPNKLSGWRTGQLTGSMESACVDIQVLAAQAEIEVPKIYGNVVNWARLVKEVGVKYMRDSSDGKQGVGAKGLEVYGPQGTSTVVASKYVPAGYAYCGDPACDEMLTEGEYPQILNEDGVGPLMRNPLADEYQSRLGGELQFLPTDNGSKLGPGGWILATWPVGT